jgi:hypothetical protein
MRSCTSPGRVASTQCHLQVALTGEQDIGTLVSLRATNTGERPVRLTVAYLHTNDGRQVVAELSIRQRPVRDL